MLEKSWRDGSLIKMKFLVLGATGMAGHTIAIYLSEQSHDVTAYTRKPFKYCKNIIGDVTDLNKLEKVINDGEYEVIINCIGILNQDAEDDKYLAVFLNTLLPHFLTKITRDSNTRIFHMSTDCVFSGKTGGYTENSLKDGETFYDRSKALGEICDDKNLTFRNSIIGPDISKNGIGLFNWFMKQNGSINGYNRAIWTGVTTLTLAKAMENASTNKLTGLYNLVNNYSITKYELLKLFNKYFKEEKLNINKTQNTPIDKTLINTRKDFNFIIPSYEEMVLEMKDWVYNHKELYPHYFD
jgi:dTDP-4-dehydrorhamnose reductase